ncbi:MAG: NHLP family bacteriocin export ABC transporter peptidase/permease/ATPase subunit [Halanaerobiales bacterium]
MKKIINKLWSLRGVEKVPTVLQMEALECGAAALAMIFSYNGKNIPLEQLRTDCGVSRDGSKASNILKAARAYGFIAKGYRMEPENLKEKDGPFIVFWNFNHFLVVEGFYKNKVYLNDPASGPRVVSYQEFDQSFTGIVLTFEPGEDFKQEKNQKSTHNSLKNRFKGSEKALLYILFISLMLVIPGLLIPVFSRVFIDQILLAGKESWLEALLTGIFMTAVLRGILTWLQQYYLLQLETKIAVKSSAAFLWHILRLPIRFFTQRIPGDISDRISGNDRVATLLSRELATALLGCITALFYFILMLYYDPFLSTIGLVVVFINFLFLQLLANKRENINNKLLVERGKVVGTAMSGIQIIETLKATGSESDYFARWAGYHAKWLNSEQEMSRSTQYLIAVPELLQLLTIVVILILGSYRVLSGSMTVGMLVAFQFLMISFISPINDIVGLGSRIQEVKGDMNRLDDALDYEIDPYIENDTDFNDDNIDEVGLNKDEVNIAQVKSVTSNDYVDSSSQTAVVKLSGDIKIKELSFGYNPLEDPVVKDFSLELKPGSRIALVGGSGSGKSTIARLISGLYLPWTGTILFDGRERQEIPRMLAANSIAYVDQEVSIYEGTVSENIRLWDDTIPESEVIRAARDACIHELITGRPGAYDSKVEEGGRNFSGGQKQRLEIARALVNNPTILILDEASSALDPRTEKKIDENIRKRGCTSIIVAHRLSTIRDCDEIIVLKDGVIVQRGTHEELKDLDGDYARLIASN